MTYPFSKYVLHNVHCHLLNGGAMACQIVRRIASVKRMVFSKVYRSKKHYVMGPCSLLREVRHTLFLLKNVYIGPGAATKLRCPKRRIKQSFSYCNGTSFPTIIAKLPHVTITVFYLFPGSLGKLQESKCCHSWTCSYHGKVLSHEGALRCTPRSKWSF